MTTRTVAAEPEPITIDLEKTAVVMIDMQRDFLEKGGFGETLGNDVSLLSKANAPCRALLETARRKQMLIVHTREGHRPDLSDAPKAKVERGAPSLRIGAPGPMGRILIRGVRCPLRHQSAARSHEPSQHEARAAAASAHRYRCG